MAHSNPGSRPLSWSLASSDSATVMTQASLLHALGPVGEWLRTNVTAGTVAPGATSSIQVIVRSRNLLPGVYIGTLLFTAPGGVDSPQSVNVSLTVQPHCSIVTSAGSLAFTAVAGQSNPGTQTVSVNATASCAGAPIPWSSSSSVSWLTVTPTSGQLKGTASAVSVGVNAASLAPGKYAGSLSLIASQSTQTVMVQVTVQAPPSPTAPIIGASPLTLNFNNTQGQPNPTGQVVTITNNGGSLLIWNASLPCLISSCWLNTVPTGGTIAPGQSRQVTINVDTPHLTPGNYVGQVTLNGFDAKGALAPGSPQTLTINLMVQPPCTISPPSSSSLSFSAVQGASSPAPQTIAFTGWGSCVWPVTWHIGSLATWLKLAPAAGTINGTGQADSIGVAASIAGLAQGTYSTRVTISATDTSSAVVQGSPQTFAVTLTILPPCTLSSPSPASLAFSVSQGQSAPAAQQVSLSETSTCARPVSWTANAGSSTWLVLSAPSGSDSGGGSTLGVNVNAAHLAPGTYTGTITITATDSTGAAVSGSPQTITVSLTVTATISGSVIACSDQTCATSQPLPGATVTLMTGSTTIATVTADASGNYSFSNVAPGTYTISAAGTDAGNIHYVGSAPVPVSGNTSLTIQAFPG